MVRDGRGQVECVEHICDCKLVLPGPNGEFFVKLARDDGVTFDDSTELWVEIETWTK